MQPRANATMTHCFYLKIINMNNISRPLREEEVIEIIKEVKKPNRKTDQKIADSYGVTRKTIAHIRMNLTWKYIDRDSVS